MHTGVFFHKEFTRKDWPVIGDKFARFPEVMRDELSFDGVALFESREATDEELLTTHTPSYLEQVKRAWYYRGAAIAVGGCIDAAIKIASGELTNALVFSVGAGHHAEPDWGGGGTYLSCIGPAVGRVRRRVAGSRISIIDTDSHHGNGTRGVFIDDPDVLHVCFCDVNAAEGNGTKVDVDLD